MSKRIPLSLVPTYWEWIRNEADAIGTDGCSAVSGIHVECCFEHDLAYRHAKDPRDAYRKSYDPDVFPGEHWTVAKPIDREEADRRFRQCHRNRSLFGNYSPMAFWRWAGVRVGGQSRWDAHRVRERAESV